MKATDFSPPLSINKAYRAKVRKQHADVGGAGDSDVMVALKAARDLLLGKKERAWRASGAASVGWASGQALCGREVLTGLPPGPDGVSTPERRVTGTGAGTTGLRATC